MSLSLCPLDREVYRVTFKISRVPGGGFYWMFICGESIDAGCNSRAMHFPPKLFLFVE